MDFTYTDEQKMLRDSIGGYLQQHYSFDVRRSASVSQEGWRKDIWRSLATDLGILGVALPENLGGLGGGAVEQMIIMEELGRALVLEPYLECVIMAGSLLQEAGGQAAHSALSAIGGGEEVIVPAWTEPGSRFSFSDVRTQAARDGGGWRLNGQKAVVSAAPWASRLIVTARTGGGISDAEGISLFLIDSDAHGLDTQAYPTIDGRRAAEVTLNDVAVGSDALLGPEGGGLALLEKMGDRAVSALSAEAVGIANYMLDTTIGYTRQRKQFGQPLASFQVLQHRMVDMYMQIEMARSAMYLSTLKLDAEPRERAMAASAAKVTIANACRFVGQNAIQLHGGMGMTDEMPVTHYFKRATMIEHELGSADHHLARFERLSRPSWMAA